MHHSGSVLFTIRVHSYKLARVATVPGAAARLAGAIRALPVEVAAYKSLPVFRDALLAFLDTAAVSGPDAASIPDANPGTSGYVG